MKRDFCTIAALLSVLLGVGDAQQHKTPIAFTCTCKDDAGALFATALRDVIAASPRYYLADMADDKDAKGNSITKWHLSAVSIDANSSSPGNKTAISIVTSLGGTYLMDNAIQICGKDVAKSCAEGIFSDLDQMITNLGK